MTLFPPPLALFDPHPEIVLPDMANAVGNGVHHAEPCKEYAMSLLLDFIPWIVVGIAVFLAVFTPGIRIVKQQKAFSWIC